MINTNYTAYIYTIPCQKPQTALKNVNSALVLTEKNDTDNNVYRNAVTKATEIADVDRYSQGTFDLSLLVAGRNADSYFSGTMSSACDVDYFHVDTSSQMLSRRPVIVTMEMPEGADYDLTVYDAKGNQVGMAIPNEDGTKTLTIPCDWSSSRNFVIKVSQHNSENGVEGNYKLTFSQGEMPRETIAWMERMKTAKVVQTTPEERYALGKAAKEKNDARNTAGINALHQAQYNALPEALKYTGDLSAAELLEQEKRGVSLSEAEQAYVAIYGNQNEIFGAESMRMKRGLEQEFSDYLESLGLSNQSFQIHLTAMGKVEVSGLDEERREQVEHYMEEHWGSFKNVYLTNSEETAAMTNQQYRIAGYAEECNRFLSNASGGRISVEDLTIQEKQTGQYSVSEKIAGLPAEVAQLINDADSTSPLYDYKQMLYSILEYRKVHGEIPQYHMDFKWNGRELQFA